MDCRYHHCSLRVITKWGSLYLIHLLALHLFIKFLKNEKNKPWHLNAKVFGHAHTCLRAFWYSSSVALRMEVPSISPFDFSMAVIEIPPAPTPSFTNPSGKAVSP